MGSISGKLARVRYTAATPTSSTNQAATLAAGGINLTINATGRRRWDPESTLLRVYGASTSAAYDSTSYVVDYPIGRVRFSTAHSTSVTYTVDVPWLATSYLGQTRSWTMETRVDMLDCTAFSTGSSGRQFRSYVPGLSDVSVTLGRLFNSSATGPVMVDRALLDSPFYLELVLNSTDQAGFVCYGRVQTDAFAEDAADLAKETVTFKPTGQVYYTT
jgi:hypothetical protein